MAKLPYMQFFHADWLTDTQPLSPAARGLWIDMIAFLWRATPRGGLTFSKEQWCRLLRCDNLVLVTVLEELESFSICNIVTDANGKVTVSSRRILKEEKSRANNNLRQANYREKHRSNGAIREHNGDISYIISHSSKVIDQNKRDKKKVDSGGSINQDPAPPLSLDEIRTLEDLRVRWNSIPGVKPCKAIDGALAKKLSVLKRDHDSSWWEALFTEVVRSKFLTGRVPGQNGKKPFRANLDWVTGPINLGKVLSGNYDDEDGQTRSTRGVM